MILLVKSILLASCIALTSTLVGGVLAFFLVKTDLRAKGILRLCLLLPLFLPPYIQAVAWMDVVGRLDVSFSGFLGVFFVMTTIYAPLAMLVVSSGFSGIVADLEEAALMFADGGVVFGNIVLPLLKPSLLASFVLIFVLSISEFSVPSFLSVDVLTTDIFTEFAAFYDHLAAGMKSLLLVAICFALLLLEGGQVSRASFLSLGLRASSSRIGILSLGQKRSACQMAMWAYVFLTVFFPLGMLAKSAFSSGYGTWQRAFHILWPTVLPSIALAFMGSLFIACIGLFIAFQSRLPFMSIVRNVLFFLFALPSTVIGIGLIKLFNNRLFSFVYSSLAMVILVYLCKFLFVSERLVANRFFSLPKSLEESATLLGAKKGQVLARIVFPLCYRAIFAAFVISFILCMSELGGTILVYPPGTSLMPIKVFTTMANAPQSLVSAMCILVLFITFLALGFLFCAGYVVRQSLARIGWRL